MNFRPPLLLQHIIYLTAILTPFLTAATPSPPLNLTTPSSSSSSSPSDALSAPNAGISCYPSSLFSSRYATTRDCINAVSLLPPTVDPGPFHAGGPPDVFSLPAARTFGSCAVTVSLASGSVDRGSWLGVAVAAGQVLQGCSTGSFPVGRTAGWVYVGNRGGVKVVVEKAGGGEGGGRVGAASS